MRKIPSIQMLAKTFPTYKHMKKKTFKHTLAIPFTDAGWYAVYPNT